MPRLALPRLIAGLLAMFGACSPVGTPTPIPPSGPPPITQLGGGPEHRGLFAVEPLPTQPRVLWSRKVAAGFTAAPIVSEDTLYAGSTDGTLFALDAATGAEQWRFAAGGTIRTTPALFEGRLYFGAGNLVFAVTAESGAEAWSLRTGSAVVASPAVNLNAIVVGSYDGGIYKLRPDTGEVDWRYQTVIGRNRIESSPAFADRAIVFGSFDQYVHALQPLDGDVLWEFETADDVAAAVAIAGDVALAASRDNRLYAIDLASGSERWHFETADDIDAAPAVDIAGGAVFVASRDAHLYALDLSTGRERWRFEADFGLRSSPVIADSVLYFGSVGGTLFALDAAAGTELWRIGVEGEIVAPPLPAAAGGVRLFVVTASGWVYALG